MSKKTKTLSFAERKMLSLEREKLTEAKKEVARLETSRKIETDAKKKKALGSDLEDAIGEVAKIQGRIDGYKS